MMYAVAEASTLQEAVNRNDSLLSVLQRSPAVAAVSGVGEMLPSQSRQKVAADRWNAFWSDHSRQELLRNFEREALAQGFSIEAFEPFMNLISENAKISDIEYFTDIIKPFTLKYIYPFENGYRIVNYVKTEQRCGASVG